MFTSAAFATSGLSAHCEVPGFNGNALSAGGGTKEVNGSSAYLYDVTAGGGYKVDVRQCVMQSSCSGNIIVTGAWVGPVSTNVPTAYVDGNSRMQEGNYIRLQFSSALTTLVRTEVGGTWDTN